MRHEAFWDEFYGVQCDSYDWFPAYEDFRGPLLEAARCGEGLSGVGEAETDQGLGDIGEAEKARVLHVGCGTSSVAQGLWKDGFRSICNVDFSASAVSAAAAAWEALASELESVRGCSDEASAMRREV